MNFWWDCKFIRIKRVRIIASFIFRFEIPSDNPLLIKIAKNEPLCLNTWICCLHVPFIFPCPIQCKYRTADQRYHEYSQCNAGHPCGSPLSNRRIRSKAIEKSRKFVLKYAFPKTLPLIHAFTCKIRPQFVLN